ncbi:MAG: carboxypeptidase-like regulatory domain-containing protein [Propionicimonas sp.]|uniref:carboxypeptidase-like regulatory domain-containing protein n=1 Tax=Propionicimonas sp. TaxID=1955623 RepID=UPI003D0B1E06
MADDTYPGADDLLDATDDRILAGLATLYETIDPVPADLAERIDFTLAVAELEADIAELTRGELVGVRGEETDSVTFTSGSLSLMVTTVVAAHHVRIDGWVTSPGATVDAVAEGVTRSSVTDDSGRFALDDLPRGRVHFVVRRDGYRPVITPSMEL